MQNGKIASLQGFDTQAPHTGESEDILGETYFQKKILKVGAKACPEVLPALTESWPWHAGDCVYQMRSGVSAKIEAGKSM